MKDQIKITIEGSVNSGKTHLTVMIEEMIRSYYPDVEIDVRDQDGKHTYDLVKHAQGVDPSLKKLCMQHVNKVVIENRSVPHKPYEWEKLSGLAIELPPGVVTLVPASNDSMGLLLSEQASPEEIVKSIACDDVFTPAGVKGPSRDP